MFVLSLYTTDKFTTAVKAIILTCVTRRHIHSTLFNFCNFPDRLHTVYACEKPKLMLSQILSRYLDASYNIFYVLSKILSIFRLLIYEHQTPRRITRVFPFIDLPYVSFAGNFRYLKIEHKS